MPRSKACTPRRNTGRFGAWARRCCPSYLTHLCVTPWFHDQLAQLTRGQGARRERLRPELLSDLKIPLPDTETQELLEATFERVSLIKREHGLADLDLLLPSLLAKAFGNGSA